MLFNRLENGIVQCQRDFEWDSWFDCDSNVVNFLMALERENTDLQVCGDWESLGNWDMCFPLYDYYVDAMYWVSGADCDRYAAGELLELHPQRMDMEHRVWMEEGSGDSSYLFYLHVIRGDRDYQCEKVVITPGTDIEEVLKNDFSYLKFPGDCNVDYDDKRIWSGENLIGYFVPVEGSE